jgi:DNA-binding transcriptional MerR regulator
MRVSQPCLTSGEVARRLGCRVWQVRRLYERGLLPPAARLGQYRVIRERDLPTVEAALRKAGYLPQSREASRAN